MFKHYVRASEVAEVTGLTREQAERLGPWFVWLDEVEDHLPVVLPEPLFGDLL